MRKTSLGLNLVKPRPEAGPRVPGIRFARRLCIVYRALHESSCLERIEHCIHARSFYCHPLFNSQESAGHCQSQRAPSAEATNGAVLFYNHRAKFSVSFAKGRKKTPFTKRQAGKDQGIHTTHDACPCTPVRRKAPSSLARPNIPVWIIQWNSVCQTPVEFLGLQSVQK